MKALLTMIAVLALTVGAASWTHAESPIPTEKCDDLQDRCLHRENLVCEVWKNECMGRHPANRGGAHRSKKHHGRRRHVSTDRVLAPLGNDGVRI